MLINCRKPMELHDGSGGIRRSVLRRISWPSTEVAQDWLIGKHQKAPRSDVVGPNWDAALPAGRMSGRGGSA